MAKKKYSINWEDEEAVSFEVNGVEYKDLEDIPDEADRMKLEAMMDSAEDAEFDAEFEKATKELEQVKGPAVEKVVMNIFTGVSVLMFVIAAIASYFNIQKLSREESAPGKVVDVISRDETVTDDNGRTSIQTYFYPIFQFVSKDGKSHRVQLNEGSYPPAYEGGEEITVLYDPQHPLDARIKSVSSDILMWLVPGITGLLGTIFIGVVLAVRKFMLPERDQLE